MDGNGLVFVCGWCCDRGFLAPQLEFFAKERKRRVVFLDLRGHGQSTGYDSECTIEQLAADVASVIEQCGLDRTRVSWA